MTTAVLKPMGLAFPEYICMRALSQSPGKPNAELARAFHISPQAMIAVVRGLQQRGLVTRPATTSPGTALPANLTPNGLSVVQRADSQVRAAEERILTNLTQEQHSDLPRVLSALSQHPPRRIEEKHR